MPKIKIGRKEYQTQKGDYIQYNGGCHMFCSGDGRTLKQKGWSSYSHLQISKAALKKLDLDSMEKKEVKGSFKDVTRWYFE